MDALPLPTLGHQRVTLKQRRLQCDYPTAQNNIRQYCANTATKRVGQRHARKENKDMTKTGGDYCMGVSLCVCAAGCYLSCLKVFLSTWHLRLELMLPADWHLTCNTLPPQLSAGPKVNATAHRIDLYPSPTRRHARRVTCTRKQAHSAVLARTHTCARLKYTHACVKSIIWQVSNPALVCCPPSPLPSSFFLFLYFSIPLAPELQCPWVLIICIACALIYGLLLGFAWMVQGRHV